jgi:protein-L-isoaspartate O-methyltransferase
MPDLEQHFLVDPDVLAWIVAELDPRPGEAIVELGAGGGTIAAVLLGAIAPASLTLLEIDPLLAAGLRERFPGVRVVADDWNAAWATLGPVDALVVSLPDAQVAPLLEALGGRPPRVAVVAVAAGRNPRLPPGLVRTATRPLPRTAFAPPQPFDGEAWVLRPFDRHRPHPPAR